MLTYLTSTPTVNPVDLELLRLHCRVDEPNEFQLLKLYAAGATDFLEKYLGRSFLVKNYSWTFGRDDNFPINGFMGLDYVSFPLLWNWMSWEQSIMLPRVTTSLSSVVLNYWQYDAYTLTPSVDYAYDLNTAPGKVKFYHYDQVVYHTSSVTVNFTSGYGTTTDSIPPNILRAIMVLTSEAYDQRGDTGYSNEVLERVYDMVANERLACFGSQWL
jgi:hypothetical protein